MKSGIDISDLRIDDNGDVVGLEEKIAKLKEAKPHWFKGDSKKDDADGKKRNLLPPERKDGNVDGNAKDWNKAKPDEIRDKLAEFGVTRY